MLRVVSFSTISAPYPETSATQAYLISNNQLFTSKLYAPVQTSSEDKISQRLRTCLCVCFAIVYLCNVLLLAQNASKCFWPFGSRLQAEPSCM